MTKVVFSIDDWSNLRQLSKFLKLIETQRVMGKLKGDFKILQGCYKGELEIAFMAEADDFKDYVLRYGWVDQQESILIIEEDNKATLEYRSKPTEDLGTWTNVSEKEKGESYTYDPKNKTWWTCR